MLEVPRWMRNDAAMRPIPKLLNLFFCAAFALMMPPPLHAGGPLDPGFGEAVFVSGLSEPVSMAWAPDGSGRLFVTEKSKGVRIVQNRELLPTPFATFPQLYSASECGVLGICFDPNYVANRYVYVFVTVSASRQRIVRFTDVKNIGADATNLVNGLPTNGVNHNGGALSFGPDGKLYWAIGDNGSKRGVDNDLTTLAGKVGRANVDGTVPVDNPFEDGSHPNNDYIWATGFRNPFTMTFQPRTGKLWLNVVGSNPEGQTEPNSGPGYEQVFVLNAGDDGGYDDYEGNQPNGSRYNTPFVRPFAHPVLQYKTSNSDESDLLRTVATIARSGGVATVATTAAHPYRIGQAVRLAGVSDPSFNAILCVRSVPSASTFTAVSAGADANATGGAVRPFVVGSSIAGGAFYESSGFPAEYRGNFFFGDYTGGKVMRAIFDAQNRLTNLSVFSTGAGNPVDTAVGPDGALYVADIGTGTIRRIAAIPDPAKLVVTPTIFNMHEGGQAAFSVRLGAQPAGMVVVNTHRISADEDEVVASGETLTFTPENWNLPQAVTIAAIVDEDSVADSATFLVTAPNLVSETVSVSVTDTTANAPVLSEKTLTIREGQSASFLVNLPQPQARTKTLYVRRVSGTAARVVEGGALVFLPGEAAKRVTIYANQDADALNGSAQFAVGGPGFTARSVSVAVVDDDPRAPVFGSVPMIRAVLGLPYRYTAHAAGQPVPVYDLIAAPTGMIINSTSGVIDWTPAALGQFNVTVRATNGLKPGALQAFTITVASDATPTVVLHAPANGATISGANAEFFGTSTDDYGCFKAEFFVDNALIYTDLNRTNHYHAGGAHQHFDTTAFSNGAHTLKITVYDDHNLNATATAQVTIAN